jgi:Domain of unknown function (DUF4177)
MKYEYKIITLHYAGSGAHREANMQELNGLGSQGWHVVDVSPDPESENGEIRNLLLQLDHPA